MLATRIVVLLVMHKATRANDGVRVEGPEMLHLFVLFAYLAE